MKKLKNKYITPKIIEIEIGRASILAGSGDNNVDAGGSKGNLNESAGTYGSWGSAKAPLRQSIDEWNEEEWI